LRALPFGFGLSGVTKHNPELCIWNAFCNSPFTHFSVGGGLEEAAGVYAETKIEELAERKLRLDKPELAQKWDKIQHRERQAAIPTIESTQSRDQDLGRSLTLSRTADED
jgi:hypothetical protein